MNLWSTDPDFLLDGTEAPQAPLPTVPLHPLSGFLICRRHGRTYKESDIKLRHYCAKSHGLERDNPAKTSAPSDPTSRTCIGTYGEESLDVENDDFDFDDDDFAEEMSTEWNLHKCAAAALDVLAVRFAGDLLVFLLDPLKEKLWSTNWLQRENGILALGAMIEGCIDSIELHLPTLVQYLTNTLSDPMPLVRSTICWTLGRYANRNTQPISEEHQNKYFVQPWRSYVRACLT